MSEQYRYWYQYRYECSFWYWYQYRYRYGGISGTLVQIHACTLETGHDMSQLNKQPSRIVFSKVALYIFWKENQGGDVFCDTLEYIKCVPKKV